MNLVISAILLLAHPLFTFSKNIDSTAPTLPENGAIENDIIDFDEEYTVKFNKKYGASPWNTNDFDKNTHKYTIVRDHDKNNSNISYNPNNTRKNNTNVRYNPHGTINKFKLEETTTEDFKVIPIELLSTTEDVPVSEADSTTEQDLTVIPLSNTSKLPGTTTQETFTIPSTIEKEITTEISQTTTNNNSIDETSTITYSNEELKTTWEPMHLRNRNEFDISTTIIPPNSAEIEKVKTNNENQTLFNITEAPNNEKELKIDKTIITKRTNIENINTDLNITKLNNDTDIKFENRNISDIESAEEDPDVPVFTELDTEDLDDIPEDYYDSKDVLPTSIPKTDAISVLFGLAGSVVESVVESVAEKVVPKSIYDLFKRMQRQNEALEAERLRSREENGGLGQFGRGILKSLSTGLGRPLSQLMAGVKEAGSLDTDRGFVGNVASSVTSVASAANTYLEAFKDKVQAIYPGTVWCGDGRSAQARSSSDLGLFFFTDTCCRQHDACKIYIEAGDTKYGLTNTGLFTRSHCSCDAKFRDCLRRTNSLVSAQIGLTYFNVLSPQCFRRAHPIIKCSRRTRLTGQKCEEYELDYTKPRMWQWFDNETF